MVAPAVCPYDGVQAVGSCVHCKKPFCASHQAWRGQTYYVDVCCFCLGPSASEIQRGQEDAAKAFVTSGSAARMLRDAGVGTVSVHKITTTTENKAFGRYRTVERVDQIGRGWLLGKHLWRYTEGGWGGYDVETKHLTVLMNTSLEMVFQGQQGGYRLAASDPRGPNTFRGYYSDIYRQIHRLAGRTA